MSAVPPIAGRWIFTGAFLQRGHAVGPTHEFETAEEFIELNDDDPSHEWMFPAARVVDQRVPSWIELRADGNFFEHEEPGAGPRRWHTGGLAGEAGESGTWESIEGDFAARIVPTFVHHRMAPVYFDEVRVEASGELYRRVVSVVDGLYVDFVRAYYRRPDGGTPSSLVAFVREQLTLVEALADALGAALDVAAKSAAGARFATPDHDVRPALRAVHAAAGQREPWACAVSTIAKMATIRTELKAIPQRSAPYKREMKEVVDGYFEQLRNVEIDAEAELAKRGR